MGSWSLLHWIVVLVVAAAAMLIAPEGRTMDIHKVA